MNLSDFESFRTCAEFNTDYPLSTGDKNRDHYENHFWRQEYTRLERLFWVVNKLKKPERKVIHAKMFDGKTLGA